MVLNWYRMHVLSLANVYTTTNKPIRSQSIVHTAINLLRVSTMRKVEQAIINAIESGKVGRMNLSPRDTVEVIDDSRGLRARVLLHGNHIATIYYNEQRITIGSAGWETVTTKSRLNALLHTYVGKGISQRKFVWYVYDYTNRADPEVEFESGMSFDITKPFFCGDEWKVNVDE